MGVPTPSALLGLFLLPGPWAEGRKAAEEGKVISRSWGVLSSGTEMDLRSTALAAGVWGLSPVLREELGARIRTCSSLLASWLHDYQNHLGKLQKHWTYCF